MPEPSNYRLATLAAVVCPKCGATNQPAEATPTIDVDLLHSEADCSTCGHAGPLESFLPKSEWA